MPPSAQLQDQRAYAARFFGGGTFFPERRASDNPIAIACFGFVTFFPLRPDFSLPRLNSCISLFTSLPAEGEYLRRDDDFFEEDFLPALLDFLVLELFFAELFLVLLFFALLFFVLDFFALLDLFLAAFFVAIAILPRTQMVPSFETVVWNSGNPARKCCHNKTRAEAIILNARAVV